MQILDNRYEFLYGRGVDQQPFIQVWTEKISKRDQNNMERIFRDRKLMPLLT